MVKLHKVVNEMFPSVKCIYLSFNESMLVKWTSKYNLINIQVLLKLLFPQNSLVDFCLLVKAHGILLYSVV